MSTKKIPEGAGEHFRGPRNPTQPSSDDSSSDTPAVVATASLSELGRLVFLKVDTCPRCAGDHVFAVRMWSGSELDQALRRECPETQREIRVCAVGGDAP